MAKVIIIDPVLLKITMDDLTEDEGFAKVYKWVRSEVLDHITGPRVNAKGDRGCMFVDDIGLYTNKPRWKWMDFYHSPIAGAGVLFGSDAEGETIDVPYTVDDIMKGIQWQVLIPQKEDTDGLH